MPPTPTRPGLPRLPGRPRGRLPAHDDERSSNPTPSPTALAALLYRVDRRHRKVGLENLRLAFGDDYTEAERDAIVRGVYRHFCMMLMEILHIPRKLHPTTWASKRPAHPPRRPPSRSSTGCSRAGPIVMVTGHFGNWEMAGYLFGVFGFPPSSVARALDNPHLDRFLRSFRERTGQKLIPKKGGYDEMLGVLRSGGVLSFLADQDAERPGDVRRLLRPARLHAQGDRPAGHRAQGPGHRRLRAADRTRVPLRGRLRGDPRPVGADGHVRRRAARLTQLLHDGQIEVG